MDTYQYLQNQQDSEQKLVRDQALEALAIPSSGKLASEGFQLAKGAIRKQAVKLGGDEAGEFVDNVASKGLAQAVRGQAVKVANRAETAVRNLVRPQDPNGPEENEMDNFATHSRYGSPPEGDVDTSRLPEDPAPQEALDAGDIVADEVVPGAEAAGDVGLEGLAGGLDSTGVGAIIGVPLMLAGLAGLGASLGEMFHHHKQHLPTPDIAPLQVGV